MTPEQITKLIASAREWLLVYETAPSLAERVDAKRFLCDFAKPLCDALESERAKLSEATAALRNIAEAEPEPFTKFPADWREQIAACPECQGWAKNHPIQQGICDTHRRPLWDRDKHEIHEEVAMRYRHERTAKDALKNLK